MKTRKVVSVAMAALMASSALTACKKEGAEGAKEFSSFFCTPATVEITDDNEVQAIITEKVGAKCKETWLTGQDAGEAIGVLMASGEYPDFINGGDSSKQLYEAGALVAWDEYIDKYPNIKEFYTDYEWDQFRQDDGHIYWMNPFDNIYGEDICDLYWDSIIIDEASMTASARALAYHVYDIIARAEAIAHDMPAEEVHFHEVASLPSIADVIAFSVCYDRLGALRKTG